MQPDLQWQTNPRATILHALQLLADEAALIDHSIVSTLAPWGSTVRDLHLSERFWIELLSTVSDEAAMDSLIEKAAVRSESKCVSSEVANVFQTAETKILSSNLDVAEELRLRLRPLREIWEASGPGMLFQIKRWTKQSIPPQLQVDGLLPICGGFGQAFPDSGRVQIELVLANPTAEVPEVVRLAWLVAQLSIPNNTDSLADRLALVPCCLASAEQLGIAQCQVSSLITSLQQWQIFDTCADKLGETLYRWWNDRDEDTPWNQATTELRDLVARVTSGSR